MYGKCNYDLSSSQFYNSYGFNFKWQQMARIQFVSDNREDVAMHCTCKREYVAALLLEEKPQEMEIEVSLSVCVSSV